MLHEKSKAKEKKAIDIEEIRDQLRGTMGARHTHDMDEDDDDDEDEEVYMYPTNMDLDERIAYRETVHASKATEWERQQHENLVGSKRKTGESSRRSGAPIMRKSQSMRHSDPSPPIAPSLYKSSKAKQKNIKDMLKGGSIKETTGRLISKFFIYDSVTPNKANSHHFKNMIIGAQQAGMGIEPPSPYEIKNKYLEMEYKDMEAYVNQQREKWKTYGCTIMSDGWTGPTRLSIINFMVCSKGSTVFLKSVDASNSIKDHKYIYKLLKNVIKEVGIDNVVQIVTDNGSASVKAGKLLMKKFNLYWTPCAAHCINLMFEDIGKRPSTAELMQSVKEKTIKREFEVKEEDVVNDDAYIGGTYHLGGNGLKEKVLKGISDEEVYKLQFDCIDEAETFYNVLAKVAGFSIRKDDLKQDKNGDIISRKWVCSREGQRVTKFIENDKRQHEPRSLTRVGCEAAFRVGLNRKDGKWIVNEFIEEHNHNLVDAINTQFLRSHRTISNPDKAQVDVLRKTRQAKERSKEKQRENEENRGQQLQSSFTLLEHFPKSIFYMLYTISKLRKRAGDKFGTGHSLNEERKLDPAVEDEWRLEHGDTTDYGGEDDRLWRSVEMRARDIANHGQPTMNLWRSVEMRARDTANHGGEDARLWKRREGKNGKRVAEKEREQVENEGRERINGKMG
ncbi:hypothetical protein VitviT2T_011474 [Vitis vinifera]|uniref:WRKY domain-containing protein n=1 Tax=Vitis vinifera TaxID=29760 RepID=A0ABY9CCL2_VITVI|nr:hypothetical protein VitviT2T_011474 [Vitis vinifera]